MVGIEAGLFGENSFFVHGKSTGCPGGLRQVRCMGSRKSIPAFFGRRSFERVDSAGIAGKLVGIRRGAESVK